DFMTNYNNASIDDEFLSDAYSSQKISDATCKPTSPNDTKGGNGSCVAKYLLQKIGTKQNVTDEGLCRAVLDKCQRYTYKDGKYIPYNDVVVNYVQRAMVNIRAAQQDIISEYASSCMVDIATCYNQQVTQVNSWSSSASINSIYNVMRGACRNVALTCAYAVFYKSDAEICYDNNGKVECSVKLGDITDTGALIDAISEMFYQSLLCPDNSEYQAAEQTSGDIGNNKQYVNSHCKCKSGYKAWGNSCLVECDSNATRNTYGTCVCNTNYTMENGVCKQNAT
ncbi:MAG: hypothetical protein IJ517_03845, partial [Alphaproteobacteria bacterium]|nr:hypothetical protein [Alphaproteobacteria bacterium]